MLYVVHSLSLPVVGFLQLYAPFLPSCCLPELRMCIPRCWLGKSQLPTEENPGKTKQSRFSALPCSPFPVTPHGFPQCHEFHCWRQKPAPGMFLLPKQSRDDGSCLESKPNICAPEPLSSAELWSSCLLKPGEYFQQCHRGFCALVAPEEQEFHQKCCWCVQKRVPEAPSAPRAASASPESSPHLPLIALKTKVCLGLKC